MVKSKGKPFKIAYGLVHFVHSYCVIIFIFRKQFHSSWCSGHLAKCLEMGGNINLTLIQPSNRWNNFCFFSANKFKASLHIVCVNAKNLAHKLPKNVCCWCWCSYPWAHLSFFKRIAHAIPPTSKHAHNSISKTFWRHSRFASCYSSWIQKMLYNLLSSMPIFI